MARRKDFQFDGALALVTGAGSGIGRAVSLALAGHGTRVLAVDLDAEAAEKTAAACGELGPEARGLACDVGDAGAVTALAQRVHAEWGPLDILVNNAGVGMSGCLHDMSATDWEWIRRVNLDGVVHGCLAFGPAMLERGHGHVVITASILGYVAHAHSVAYGATKAAVLLLAQGARADWRRYGVGVSAICPGLVNTSIMNGARLLGDRVDERESLVQQFSRGAPPELVASEVVRAIREDRAVVPVGPIAKAGWWMHRLAPMRLQQVAARVGLEPASAAQMR